MDETDIYDASMPIPLPKDPKSSRGSTEGMNNNSKERWEKVTEEKSDIVRSNGSVNYSSESVFVNPRSKLFRSTKERPEKKKRGKLSKEDAKDQSTRVFTTLELLGLLESTKSHSDEKPIRSVNTHNTKNTDTDEESIQIEYRGPVVEKFHKKKEKKIVGHDVGVLINPKGPEDEINQKTEDTPDYFQQKSFHEDIKPVVVDVGEQSAEDMQPLDMEEHTTRRYLAGCKCTIQ